jgi:hypothetical protein
MQQVVDLSLKFGRKVALAGRSLSQNMKIARDLGKLAAPDDAFVDADEIGDLRPRSSRCSRPAVRGSRAPRCRGSRRMTIRRSPPRPGTSSCCRRA